MRESLGTAGLIVGVVALVAALAGVAFAAGGGLNPTQKKEVKKIAKQFAGKNGATGPQGAAGSNGTNGKDGAPGAKGENGAPGEDGKSVEIGTATSTPSGECPSVGGATVEVEGEPSTKKAVCNGSPWTAGGTLPSGASEQGEWALIGHASGPFQDFGNAVSFGIPLETAPAAHYLRASGKEPFYNEEAEAEEERTQPECPGTVAEPLAKPGNLCVYASTEEDTAKNPFSSIILPAVCPFASGGFCLGGGTADNVGFGIDTVSKEEGTVNVVGTWAVTAE